MSKPVFLSKSLIEWKQLYFSNLVTMQNYINICGTIFKYFKKIDFSITWFLENAYF